MMNREKDFIKIDDFQVFPFLIVFVLDFQRNLVLALIFTKSPCLIMLSQAETSLMLWLDGNGFVKRAALFGSCRHTSQK